MDNIIDEIYNSSCHNTNNGFDNGKEESKNSNQTSFILGYHIKDPSNLKLFKNLRRKFSQIECTDMQKLLFEVNKKLLNKSLDELQYINKILK